MSLRNGGRPTKAATLNRAAGRGVSTPARPDDSSERSAAAVEYALAGDSWPSRSVTPPQVGPSRQAHSRPFNDPSDYLG